MPHLRRFSLLLAIMTLWSNAQVGNASVQFVARTLAPQITFDEIVPYTTNPIYNVGGNTVSFGTHFNGQALAPMNMLSDATPDSPLSLNTTSTSVSTVLDLSNPSKMVLGSVTSNSGFNTPIAMLLANPVNRVEFDLGHLDTAGTVTVELYGTQGQSLGVFKNTKGGIESMAFADDAGGNVIAGVSIYVGPNDMDWEGFAIDNVSFGINSSGGPNNPPGGPNNPPGGPNNPPGGPSDPGGNPPPGGEPVPEPATLLVWGLLFLIGGPRLLRRRSA